MIRVSDLHNVRVNVSMRKTSAAWLFQINMLKSFSANQNNPPAMKFVLELPVDIMLCRDLGNEMHVVLMEKIHMANNI